MADKKEIVLQKCKNAIDCGEPITDYGFYYEVIALLKKQDEEIENLKQTAQSMMEGICLLKDQDYRTWIIDMFHKYNRDDLIAFMVQKGEESILAGLLKEQEAHELTKTEWEQWKKDKNREPICMVWYGDTTPIWVLKLENVNEPLYLMGKIKLFNKKPRKEQVEWNES